MTAEIKVAKSGIDASEATSPNDFIFHSSYNTLKILAEGTLLSQSVNADPKTFTVAHGQSILPIVAAFAKYPDGKISLPDQSDYSLVDYGNFIVQVDTTNITFTFDRPGATYSVDIKYYIFEAPIV